jgi:hypothetical protein
VHLPKNDKIDLEKSSLAGGADTNSATKQEQQK